MSTVPPLNMLDTIKKGMNEAITREAGLLFDQFIEDLKKRKEQIVAGIVLNLTEQVRFDTSGRDLIITILKQDEK